MGLSGLLNTPQVMPDSAEQMRQVPLQVAVTMLKPDHFIDQRAPGQQFIRHLEHVDRRGVVAHDVAVGIQHHEGMTQLAQQLGHRQASTARHRLHHLGGG